MNGRVMLATHWLLFHLVLRPKFSRVSSRCSEVKAAEELPNPQRSQLLAAPQSLFRGKKHFTKVFLFENSNSGRGGKEATLTPR